MAFVSIWNLCNWYCIFFFQHTCLFQSGGMVLYALLLEVLWFFFLQLNGFVFVLKCSEIFRWVSVLSISFEILFILVGDFEVSLKLFDLKLFDSA